MLALQVLIGATGADGQWFVFHQTHCVASESEARDAVLGHPAAVVERWHIIEIRTVERFPLAVTS